MPTALFLHHDANSLVGLLGDAIRSGTFESFRGGVHEVWGS